jgi:uncharacterized membrane protein (GlpM family)
MIYRVLLIILGAVFFSEIKDRMVKIYRRFRPAKPGEASDRSTQIKLINRHSVRFYLIFFACVALAIISVRRNPSDNEKTAAFFMANIIIMIAHMAMCLFFGVKLILLGAKANKQAELAPAWRNYFTAAGISLLMILIALIIKMHLGI